MKFAINRLLMIENLNYVSHALSNKTPMPVLTGIKIDVRNDVIILTASNSEISIQTCIDQPMLMSIEEEGCVVLPGKYFNDILKKAEGDMVEFITFEDNTVKILANKSNFTLISMDHTNYPMISFDNSDTVITMDALNLKQLIKKTYFATSNSESRPILTGVNFTTLDNKVEAVATDSYRLAKKYMLFECQYPHLSIVIPSKSLDEILKLLEDDQENIQIHITKTKALIKYKKVLFQTRLIEGVYPNTENLIPKDFVNSVTFNRNELISTIERASLFTNIETSNIIKMSINGNNTVTISSTNSEIGTVIDELTAINCSNDYQLQLAFSAKYFLDAVKSFDSTEITVHFTGEIKPFIITGEYDYNQIELILPVRAS